MTVSQPRSGYTLPVFACAAAVAALRWLRQPQLLPSVEVDLILPAQTVEIPIEQVAGLREGMALAIALSDPGDNLDLTRNTPIWALVEWAHPEQAEPIFLLGGEGIGRQVNADGRAAIYSYAQQLLRENLERLLAPGEKIQVTIILPAGRSLATRTSNAAFGVVEGLSLLGTSGISQPLSAPGQLDLCLEELRQKAALSRGAEELGSRGAEELGSRGAEELGSRGAGEQRSWGAGELGSRGRDNQLPITNYQLPISNCLVLCVGENGIDLAKKLGINPERIVKTANWLGPVLVEAGLQQVPGILLFGYHGKLIKLAGGIFHTHHHLADGRLEILTAHGSKLGLPTPVLQEIFASATAEDALKYLRNLDAANGSDWVNQIYSAIANQIDSRSQAYIRNLSEQDVRVGSVLFDRDRQIIVASTTGAFLLSQLC